MARRSPPPLWQQPPFLAGVGIAGFLLWRLRTPDADREFSLVQGKTYQFTLLGHPYGDEADWWQQAREALAESGAALITKIEQSPGDVRIRFTKVSPVSTALPPHTVLYPSTPPLATATLLEAKLTSGPVPLGTSASVSGLPHDEDRARHYDLLGAKPEGDAKKPPLSP